MPAETVSGGERALSGPLFVIGSPRSGTSLLRLLLTCHSQIVVPPECGFVLWLRPTYLDWSVADSRDIARVGAFLADLASSRKFETWQLHPERLREAIAASLPESYAELCATVYREYGASIGKHAKLWGDKNNYYLEHLAELDALFEGSRFLHVVRDGRDVACSYREVMAAASPSPYAPVLPVAIEEIAARWSADVATIGDFLQQLAAKRARTIRYEMLTAAPETCLRGVCDWLGIDFEKEMLDFHQVNRERHLEPEATRDWKRRTLEPIDSATVGRYVRLLTAGDLATFERVGGEALRRCGYL